MLFGRIIYQVAIVFLVQKWLLLKWLPFLASASGSYSRAFQKRALMVKSAALNCFLPFPFVLIIFGKVIQ